MARKDPTNGAGAPERAAEPIEAAAPRRARSAEAARADPVNRVEPVENAIRPARRRNAVDAELAAPRAPEGARAAAASAAPTSTDAVPQRVRDRFVQVGGQWHFPDGAVAFSDRGRRLVTPSENAEVVRSLVEIAQARGWDAIAVTGTERFRKEAWAAGQLAGITVQGYRATPFEKETLARTVARRRDAAERPNDDLEQRVREPAAEGAPRRRPARDPRDGRVDGRLIEHGPAPYQHRSGESQSYYVTVETLRGPRTVWGRDLERAMKESLSQPKTGDEIRLQIVAREPVTVKRLERGDDGRSLEMRPATLQRSRWVAETQEFFDERSLSARTLRDASVEPQRGVRERPELTGSYLVLKAAEEVASRKIRDPQDRERFVATVRGALADSIERGEPLPVVRLRERARQPEKRTDRDVERAR
jgi:hypothetical protein